MACTIVARVGEANLAYVLAGRTSAVRALCEAARFARDSKPVSGLDYIEIKDKAGRVATWEALPSDGAYVWAFTFAAGLMPRTCEAAGFDWKAERDRSRALGFDW